MPLLVNELSGETCRFFRTLRVGRAPDNDLVIADRTVSSFHACIELRGGAWFVKDLGSSNGTRLDGDPVRGWTRLEGGARLVFGAEAAWTLAELARSGQGPVSPWIVRSSTGARHRVSQDRLTFGRGASWDVAVDDGPLGLHAVLFGEDDALLLMGLSSGEVTVDGAPVGDEPTPLRAGDEFVVQGRGYRLLLDEATMSGMAATARTGLAPREYRGLRLTLIDRGDFGEIVVDDDRGEHRFPDQELRFSLLLVLAQELLRQRDAGVSEHLGWMDDEALRIGIWGRRSIENQATSTLAKLMHDTRAMLGRQGIDGLFIEKKRGRSRLRLNPQDVVVR
jgi:hypothetical protein